MGCQQQRPNTQPLQRQPHTRMVREFAHAQPIRGPWEDPSVGRQCTDTKPLHAGWREDSGMELVSSYAKSLCRCRDWCELQQRSIMGWCNARTANGRRLGFLGMCLPLLNRLSVLTWEMLTLGYRTGFAWRADTVRSVHAWRTHACTVCRLADTRCIRVPDTGDSK